MKLHLTLLVCLLNLLFVIKASAAPLIRPNDRLAICGNAMTAELGYSLYIEDYLLMCQRVEGLDVSQFGWSGQTAEAFLARLDIDLPSFRPTIVTTCFGVDDGDQKATDDDTANRFRQVQTDLVAALKKRGVRIVVLGSPKCVDSFHYHRDPAQAAVRNKMLRARADIIKNVAAAEGVIYADVFNATMAAMVKAKARNGERYVFDSEDGHQPSDGCKLAMAYAFLKALGCDGNIGTITMDYKTQTVKCDPGQRIVSDKDRAVIVESTRYPFIFFDPRTRSDSVLKCIPFNEELNRYMLVVVNLPSPRVKVSWNMTPYSELRAHESRDFTADEIGKGINLAVEADTIPFGRFGDVSEAIRNQQQQEQKSGMEFVKNKKRGVEDAAKRDEYFRTALKRFVPVSHKFRIQPLSLEEERYTGPTNVIIDTDMSGDCDDAGAVALLNSFMNQGESEPCGVCGQWPRRGFVFRCDGPGDQCVLRPPVHSDRRQSRQGVDRAHQEPLHPEDSRAFQPRISERRQTAGGSRRLSQDAGIGRRWHGRYRERWPHGKSARSAELQAGRYQQSVRPRPGTQESQAAGCHGQHDPL